MLEKAKLVVVHFIFASISNLVLELHAASFGKIRDKNCCSYTLRRVILDRND